MNSDGRDGLWRWAEKLLCQIYMKRALGYNTKKNKKELSLKVSLGKNNVPDSSSFVLLTSLANSKWERKLKYFSLNQKKSIHKSIKMELGNNKRHEFFRNTFFLRLNLIVLRKTKWWIIDGKIQSKFSFVMWFIVEHLFKNLLTLSLFLSPWLFLVLYF